MFNIIEPYLFSLLLSVLSHCLIKFIDYLTTLFKKTPFSIDFLHFCSIIPIPHFGVFF